VGLKRGEKYNAKTMGERLRDNSLYVAFAPAEKPKIALALIVENAGFGAAYAAPIARKALDYYLLKKRPAAKDGSKTAPVEVELEEATPPAPMPFQPVPQTPVPKD
jgi:penicillin-binding protein 2